VAEYLLLALGVSFPLSLLAWAAASPASRRRWMLVGAAGVVAAAFSVVATPLWASVIRLAVWGQLSIVLLPSWRGVPRDLRRASIEGAIFAGIALAPVLAIAVACVLTAQWATLETFQSAIFEGGVGAVLLLGLPVLTAVLALDGARTSRAELVLVPRLLMVATAIILVVRLAWVFSVASNPLEAFWCDGPFLVNALKLSAHVPLYGPMDRLDSYTYSPLIDLLHHALLAPVGLELSLHANRALVLFDQLGAAAILGWALWPLGEALGTGRRWARAALLVVVALACFANLVSPAVHPDHPLLVCVAVAFALVAREEGWRRGVWWAALVLVTPIATAFKLSGVGIGVGLFAVFLLERRWRALAAVGVSMLLAAATVPLFGAFVGAYASYAVDVQSRGDFDLAKLASLPLSPFGLAAACTAVLAFASRGPARRVGLVTAAVAAVALPGYLKVSGRDNNLTPLLVGAVVVILLAAAKSARGTGPRFNGALPWALVLTLLVAARPLALPLAGAARAAAYADFDAMTAAVREDARDGRRTLLLLNTVPWIAAGHRDVPGDRYASAVELFFARLPEGQLLASRIAAGTYDTILAGGSPLAPRPGLLGEFNRGLVDAMHGRYVVEYPTGATDLTRVEGAVILRRSRE
jgi:hypothetical protein